jgi:DTW domain-containing protein
MQDLDLSQRGTCWSCYRPGNACLCEHIIKLHTNTRFVILMHPKEFKREKAGTGKITHAALPNSEIQWDESFDTNKRVNELLNSKEHYCVLLYPGDTSLNVSAGEFIQEDLLGRQLVVFLLDGTWACAKKMLKLSLKLQKIPRLMFTPSRPSQFHIKQQPDPLCLSTIETTHQFLEALSTSGFEEKRSWDDLLKPFMAMQDFQVQCSLDPARKNYRSGTYKTPEERANMRTERTRKLFF